MLAHSGTTGLVDADRYDGTNPGVTVGVDSRALVAAGLAEISNANFFSEDTLRGQYPSPTDAGLIPVNLVTPLGKVRRYFSRPAGQGLLPANPLKAECASDAMSLRGVPVGRAPYPCVDPLVWNQVAMHMLPRAVGYARGVLDYFFRGSLAVTDVAWDESGVRMDVWNTSDEEMEGVFEIWARHAPDSSQERRTKLVTLGGGERIRLAPSDLYTFERIAIPSDARPTARHVLVFRGRLGTEDDAVAAQVFSRAPRFLWTAFCEKENELCPRKYSTRLGPRREPGGRPERPQPRRRSSARGGGRRGGRCRWSSSSSRGNRSRASVVAMA